MKGWLVKHSVPKVILSLCRLVSKIRAQSPGSSPQYHHSPTRRQPNLNDDRKGGEKNLEKEGEQSKTETATKTTADTKNLNSSSQGQFEKTLHKNTAEKNQFPDRGNQMSPRMDSSERRLHVNRQGGDKGKAGFPCKCILMYLNAHLIE